MSCEELCKKCSLWSYVAEFEGMQFLDPIPLNETQTNEALICLLEAPALKQKASLKKLHSVLSKSIYRFNKLNVYAIFAVACNYPKDTTLPQRSIQECSPTALAHIANIQQDHEKTTIITFGGGAIKALKLNGFTFSDSQARTSVQVNRLVVHKQLESPVDVICSWTWHGGIDTSKSWVDVEADLDFLDRYLEGELKEKKSAKFRTIMTDTDLNTLWDLLEASTKGGEVIPCALDTEGSSLNVFNETYELLTVQLSFEEDFAYVCPIDHKDANPKIRDMMLDFIEWVLLNPNIMKISHNSQYDKSALWVYLPVKPVNWRFDTMHMHHLVDSDRKHDLGSVARVLCPEYGDYDAALEHYKSSNPLADPGRGGTYANIPLSILAPYGAIDAIVTLKAFFVLFDQLEESGQIDFYKNHVSRAAHQYSLMQIHGTKVSLRGLEDMYYDWASDMEDMYLEKIAEHPAVKAFEKSFEANQAYFAYCKDPDTWIAANTSKLGKLKKKIPVLQQFNPNSDAQLAKVLEKFLGLPPLSQNKTGPSYKSDLREIYLMFYKPEAPTDNPWRVDLGLVHWIEQYAKMVHSYDSFVKAWRMGDLIDKYGFFHPSYMMHGTTTGRTACNNPNMQNVAKGDFGFRGKFRLKDVLVAPKGYCMILADYSQVELRVVASLSEDKNMLNAFREGKDLHRQTASFMFQLSEEQVSKLQRDVAKGINFGLVYVKSIHSFGVDFFQSFKGDATKAWEVYKTLEAAGFGNDLSWGTRGPKIAFQIPDIFLKLAGAAVDKYFSTYPQVKAWMDETVRKAKKVGYVKSKFGRVRNLPLIQTNAWAAKEAERQAVNMPVQSAASDITQKAIIKIGEKIEKGFYPAEWGLRIFINVHDSIGFYCKIEHAKEAGPVIKAEMEDTSELPWILCPLVVDVEYGLSYGTLFGSVEQMLKEKEFDHGI